VIDSFVPNNYETLKAEIEQLQHEVRELGERRPE